MSTHIEAISIILMLIFMSGIAAGVIFMIWNWLIRKTKFKSRYSCLHEIFDKNK